MVMMTRTILMMLVMLVMIMMNMMIMMVVMVTMMMMMTMTMTVGAGHPVAATRVDSGHTPGVAPPRRRPT
jgi:hypothetical protein